MKPLEPNERIEGVEPAVMHEIVSFCNLYNADDITRLIRLLNRLDICVPAHDVENATDRFVLAVFETHLLPVAWRVEDDLLPNLRRLQVEDTEQAFRYFFHYANSCLEVETGNDYKYHVLHPYDERREVLGLRGGYARIVTEHNIAEYMDVPERHLHVKSGTAERYGGVQLLVTVPHVYLDWRAFVSDFRQGRAETEPDYAKLEPAVVRVIAASDSCVRRLKHDLANARSEFARQATHNDNGFLFVVPKMADPYRHPLSATESLLDSK